MNRISIVLPVNAKSNYDLCLCFFLLESVRRFFVLTDISTFYIICKRSKIKKLNWLYKKYIKPLKIKFVPEEDILLDVQANEHSGWLIQQILKLGASNFVETDFYLTLDCDTICCQQAGYENFIRDGKIINGKQLLEFKKAEHFKKYNANITWLKDSRALLGIKGKKDLMYGITPHVMAKQICLDLIEDIKNIGSRNWMEYLLEIRKKVFWSEQGIYYGFINKKNILEKYYNIDSSDILIDYDKCFFAENIFEDIEKVKENIAFAFSNDYGGIFLVVQSYIIPPLWLRSRLLRPIGRSLNLRERAFYFIFSLPDGLWKIKKRLISFFHHISTLLPD